MSWIAALKTEELESKGGVVVRHGARQIAVLKAGGQIFALDNRCPHEGYPLREGTVDVENCVLTCNWHHWKFDLKTGKNVLGEDDVTVYPTKVEDGQVWIHMGEKPKDVILNQILDSFQSAFRERQYGRMARLLARLHFHQLDPVIALKQAIEWSYDKLENGMGHEFAGAADWLLLYDELEEVDQRLACLTEAVDYIAYEALRQPVFAFTDARKKYSYEGFIAAMEREDQDQAVALVNDALDSGLHFADLQRLFTDVVLRHYYDFGHSLIYVYKTGILIDRLGPEVERHLLPALIRSIGLAMREDRLPEFKALPRYQQKWSASAWPAAASTLPLEAKELYFKPAEYCLDWVVARAQDHAPEEIFAALLDASAKHLLHFDSRLQFTWHNPVSKNIGWLDFTHALTFAGAARQLCAKYPEFWKPALLQMACFVGRNHSFLDAAVDEEEWQVADRNQFLGVSRDQILDHGKGHPLFSVHFLKTFMAVRSEALQANETVARRLLAALNRFLNSPLREKHVRRTVRQALELVGRDFQD